MCVGKGYILEDQGITRVISRPRRMNEAQFIERNLSDANYYWSERYWGILATKMYENSHFLVLTITVVSFNNLGLGMYSLTVSCILFIFSQTSPELTSVPFDTIQHWLVLFYIVKYEETKSPLNSSTESSPEKSAEDLYYRSSPYATRLLFIAHEYLGKRGWCCHENGEILTNLLLPLSLKFLTNLLWFWLNFVQVRLPSIRVTCSHRPWSSS